MKKFILLNDKNEAKDIYEVTAHKALNICGRDLLIRMDAHEGVTADGKIGVSVEIKVSTAFSNELCMKAVYGIPFKQVNEEIRLIIEGARAEEKEMTRFLLKKIKEKGLDQLERDQSLFDEEKIIKYWKEMYVS